MWRATLKNIKDEVNNIKKILVSKEGDRFWGIERIVVARPCNALTTMECIFLLVKDVCGCVNMYGLFLMKVNRIKYNQY
jgi:hypothetical protein